jgi:hypothetical protein
MTSPFSPMSSWSRPRGERVKDAEHGEVDELVGITEIAVDAALREADVVDHGAHRAISDAAPRHDRDDGDTRGLQVGRPCRPSARPA